MRAEAVAGKIREAAASFRNITSLKINVALRYSDLKPYKVSYLNTNDLQAHSIKSR